jgi:hypothetical protein
MPILARNLGRAARRGATSLGVGGFAWFSATYGDAAILILRRSIDFADDRRNVFGEAISSAFRVTLRRRCLELSVKQAETGQ